MSKQNRERREGGFVTSWVMTEPTSYTAGHTRSYTVLHTVYRLILRRNRAREWLRAKGIIPGFKPPGILLAQPGNEAHSVFLNFVFSCKMKNNLIKINPQ